MAIIQITYPESGIIPEQTVMFSGGAASAVRKRANRFYFPADIAGGYIETLQVNEGMLLTLSDFSFRSDIEFLDTYDDQELFQLTFCMEGEVEWSYRNDRTDQFFRIGACESQVRYGKICECRSKFSGGRVMRCVSITLDPVKFAVVLNCIRDRNALSGSGAGRTAKVYTYTPGVGKILEQIMCCPLCEELKRIYMEGKILELIAVFCDEVICQSPANTLGMQISSDDYAALLKAREVIAGRYAEGLTIAAIAKEVLISEQKLKAGFKRCFGITVNDYLTEKRMEAARRLLKSGQCKVRDAAWKVGYSHTGYFIRRFQSYYGLTPGALLKNNK